MKIGYLRVSTEEQDVARQEDGLAGICDEMHVERISAAARQRPIFEAALDQLEPGDTLVVWDLDRAFRSPVDMLLTLEKLKARGVQFQIVTLNIDTNTESGELVATMIAAVARFERRILSRRTREGMVAKKRAGHHVGRPRALSAADIDFIREEFTAGRRTIAELADRLKVSRRTIDRALAALREPAWKLCEE